ncbi:MAG: PAS domain S-box protein [Candidatus Lokiarchaeota archaeon]|nr:PAS domain S-box protein [Candidatus Lokiarchaeota archaeon]
MQCRVVLFYDNPTSLATTRDFLLHKLRTETKITDEFRVLIQNMLEGEMDIVVAALDVSKSESFELLKRIRQLDSTIPLIIFAENSTETTSIRALNLGASRYVTRNGKPDVQHKKLLAAIENEIVAVSSHKSAKHLQGRPKNFKLLYQNMPIPYQSLGKNGFYLDVNPAWLEALGYGEDEVIGRHFKEFLSPQSKKLLEKSFPEFIRNGKTPPEGVVHRLQRKDGSFLTARYTGRVAYKPNGEVRRTHCVFVDITRQVIIEQALRQSELAFRNMYENAVVGLARANLDGKLLECNHKFAEIFGYDNREHAMNAGSAMKHYPTKRDREHVLQALRKHGEAEFDRKFLRLDGSVIWGHIVMKLFPEDEYLEVAIVDITDLKNMEEKLRESQKCFRAIADYTYDWESWIGINDQLLWVNPRVEDFTGYSVEECLTMENYPLPIIHEDDRDTISAIVTDFSKHNKGNDLTFRIVTKDGITKWMALSWQPICDENDNPAGIRTSARDIGERIKATKRLQAQKRELSEFAHQMKHDIGNRLHNILGYISLIREGYEEEQLDRIEDLVRRTETLLKRSVKLADAGQIIGDVEPIDVGSVVQKIAALEIPESIEFRMDPLPIVECDRNKFEQLVENIFSNAVEHGKPSLIEVRCEETADSITLLFKNDGFPISKKTRETLFQGQNEISIEGGLGLSIARKIVEAHGWEISLDPDIMTSFRITMPKTDSSSLMI